MAHKNRHYISSWNEYKLNYWDITKCGSTAVKFCLSNPIEEKKYNPYDKKRSIHNRNNVIDINVNTALSNGNLNFSVVRNPYNRFISMYKDFGIRRPFHPFRNKPTPTIDDFIKEVIIPFDTNESVNVHIRHQSYFVTDEKNNLLIDKFVDIENLQDFFGNYNIQSRVYNKTQDIDIVLNDKQKEIIYNKYKIDFNIFGYEQ